jgi:hypothetical protein
MLNLQCLTNRKSFSNDQQRHQITAEKTNTLEGCKNTQYECTQCQNNMHSIKDATKIPFELGRPKLPEKKHENDMPNMITKKRHASLNKSCQINRKCTEIKPPLEERHQNYTATKQNT